MFEALGQKFSNVIKKLKGFGKITEANIEEALKDVRFALLEADVHVSVVRSFLEKVKARALGAEVLSSLTPTQQFLTIVHEELVSVLGGKPSPLIFEGNPPHIILMAGLQGSGKTTTTAKLANFYKKKGRHPFLVPADVYRPAAIDQLKILAKNLEIPCFNTLPSDKPTELVLRALHEASQKLCDLVFIDTAGRLHLDEEMMGELQKIKAQIPNSLSLLVVDAMTGQEALKVAKSFHEILKINGLVLSKMDGDAKGGASLSIQSIAGCPIYFTGIGEKIEDLEAFDREILANRLLDRGDLLSLVEKAKEMIDETEAHELEKKIRKNKFTLEDFRSQLRQMKKMGSMKSLMGMLPGARNMTQNVDWGNAEKELKKKEAIINSMTLNERLDPKVLNGSRRLRIAKGSGTQVSDINRFLKEYDQMKNMFQKISKGGRGLRGLLGM